MICSKQKAMSKEIERLQDSIKGSSTHKTREWWEKYMKYEIKFRGANLSVVRKLFINWYTFEGLEKRSVHEQRSFCKEMFESEWAEDKLAGVLFLELYLLEKLSGSAIVDFVEEVFDSRLIFDWNVCDWLCVRVLDKIIRREEDVAGRIAGWADAAYLWKARCSLVAFSKLAGYEQYKEIILMNSRKLIARDERWAKTAVGWLLRELSEGNKTIVSDFLLKNSGYMTREVFNNATKYFEKNNKVGLSSSIFSKS